jgi:hypothetical protein
MLVADYVDALALSLAVATASLTLTKAKVFGAFRQWVARRSQWLGELIHCPYCASHWISLLLVVVYRPCLTVHRIAVVDVLISTLVVVAAAALWSRCLCGALQAMDSLTDKTHDPFTPRRMP